MTLETIFDKIRKIDANGAEYWEARQLQEIMQYRTWRSFEEVVQRAITACKNSGQAVENHFADLRKMVAIGYESQSSGRIINDYKLSRYACYLTAQNGDPKKEIIAMAQTYFAIQTRKQETLEGLTEAEKRLHIRGKVKDQNKELFKTAARSGVSDFGTFNNMGYLGMYNKMIPEIKKKKRIGDDAILDRAGTTELAANLFRITQTEDKLKKDNISHQGTANLAHMKVGKEVRKSIEAIGGVMPEDLPPEEHIKQLEKKVKDGNKQLKSAQKSPKIERPKDFDFLTE